MARLSSSDTVVNRSPTITTRWSPTEGVLDPPDSNHHYRGMFVPGKDVRVAWNTRVLMYQWNRDIRPRECGFGKPQQERNRTLLLWEGAAKHLTPSNLAENKTLVHNSRATLVDRFRGVPGYAVRNTWLNNPDGSRGEQNRTERLDWDFNVRRRIPPPAGRASVLSVALQSFRKTISGAPCVCFFLC